jgi:ABC-type transport system involved in multi-copper enzyme maturation permease subunit
MISTASTWFDLPLLRRELLETTRRRWLWIIRGVIAFLQMGFVVGNYDDLTQAEDGFGAFGGGQEIADVLNICNLIAVYLLLPLTACAAIASERERQTLPLLLISRISASRLILEKFLSSLIPVLTLMAISLPSLALAYSLGGLSPQQLAGSVAAMLLAAVQVTTAAIFWSAVFRTSLQAFWATLFTLLVYLLGPGLLGLILGDRLQGRIFGLSVEISSLFIGFWELPWQVPFEIAVQLCLPPLIAGSVLLVGAAAVVKKYRCDAPLSRLPQPLRILRGLFTWLRKRLAALGSAGLPAGVSRPIPPMRVPAERPLAWRERSTSAAYGPRLFILLILFVPSALWMLTQSDLNFRPEDACIMLAFILMITGVLVVLSVGARSFGLERDSQTLAVLLTIPQSTHEILTQKLTAASRARLLFMTGFLVLAAIRIWDPTLSNLNRDYELPRALFEPLGLVLTWEHLTLVIWVAAAWSMFARTTLRAAVGTLATLFGYCLLHFFSLILVEFWDLDTMRELLAGLPLIAWVAIIVDDVPHSGNFPGVAPLVTFLICLSAVILGAALILLRMFVLRMAPKWLERA